MNLIINARDAFKGTAGTITVSVADQGPQVILQVSDNGCGMSSSIQAKIFEPFFTTKGEAEGTGLGLSVIAQIIKQASGQITVDSKEGEGTTFTVSLPKI